MPMTLRAEKDDMQTMARPRVARVHRNLWRLAFYS